MRTEEFLKKNNAIAVVGVSSDPNKWGYRVYTALKKKFSKVFPVNPKYGDMRGDRCYPDLKSLPERPDVVITVVPPKIAEKVVRSAKKLGIKRIWMQPGSESEEAVKFCEENGIDCMTNACFVVDGLGENL